MPYAVKKILFSIGQKEDLKKHRFFREVYSISKIQHMNVVGYKDCWLEYDLGSGPRGGARYPKLDSKITEEEEKELEGHVDLDALSGDFEFEFEYSANAAE